MSVCGLCGRQLEISDSGQPMPCVPECLRTRYAREHPLDAFLADVVRDCVGPAAPSCETCGHSKSIHDTGWDAAGCMVGPCACRAYKEPRQ